MKEFFDFDKNFEFLDRQKAGTTEQENNGMREQREEGTTGMILPRPYSKTWYYMCTFPLNLVPEITKLLFLRQKGGVGRIHPDSL